MEYSRCVGLSLICAAVAVAACSVDPPLAAPPDADATPPGDVAADTASPDVSAEAEPTDANVARFTQVVGFNTAALQLPEGIAYRDGAVYVGFAPLGQIKKVTASGEVSDYGSVPPGFNGGFTLGLAFDVGGNLYVAQTKHAATSTVLPGIYKIPAGGGVVTVPFASHPSMTFPNGIVVRPNGNLLVTDSAEGMIFEVTPAGAVTTWKTHPELTGSPACPDPLPIPVAIGANGIVATTSDVFVTNTVKGSVVRISVGPSGEAGAVTTLIRDCKYFGLDGLTLDRDGSLWATINGYPGRIVRVTLDGNVTVLGDAKPLDGPASILFAAGWNGERVALITNSAFASNADAGPQGAGLLRYGPLP